MATQQECLIQQTRRELENIGLKVEECLRAINSVPPDELRQLQEDAKELAEKSKRMVNNIMKCSRMLRELAQDVDDTYKNCEVAKVVGLGSSILGGALSIAGGVATVATAGAATPLFLAGVSFTAAGASTNVGAGIVQARKNSNSIKKAEKYLGQAINSMLDVNSFVQYILMAKETIILVYMYCFAKQQFGVHVSTPGYWYAVSLLYDVLRDIAWQKITKMVPEYISSAFSKISEVANNVIKYSSPQADDAPRAVAKTSAHAAEVVIMFNAIFVLWDVIDLGFTIRGLIINKGSNAAKILRQKAEELEDAIK